MRGFVFIIISLIALPIAAQSGRTAPAISSTKLTPGSASDPSVKDLFDEANSHLRRKAAEFEAKKIFFTDARLAQLKLEQRQLAARLATTVQLRKNLAGEDFYYLGMLHWIAENLDGTSESLQKFIASENAVPERTQTSRSIVVVVAAKQKKLDAAEKVLADYLNNGPIKLTERVRMQGELAKAYQAQKDFIKMAPHAADAFAAAKALLADSISRARGLDEILDSGTLLFEAYRDGGNQEKADEALDDMRVAAVAAQSSSFFYYAVDSKIRYLIETGRKPQGLKLYQSAIDVAAKDFVEIPQRNDALRRLKQRERHYKLLGEAAPEMPRIDKWFPGEPKSFADLKGKVVLLDFWATWCGPCLAAFPSLREWHQDYSAAGLEILGVTRYQGAINGTRADNATEIAYFKEFKKKHALPYDLVVANGQDVQILYGALSLPTAVLIDRKGVVRYAATGTSPARLEEIRTMIIKLLAEK